VKKGLWRAAQWYVRPAQEQRTAFRVALIDALEELNPGSEEMDG
jgi:hypothetical protein